jgi:hypothetical protein
MSASETWITVRVETMLALATCLGAFLLLAMPARSDEVPGEPPPAPAEQPSAEPTAQAPPAAKPKVSKASAADAPDPPMDPPSHHTGDAGPQHPEHGSMGAVGAKIANPVSDMWSIQFNFQGPSFNDGDVNSGDPKVGGNVLFQPVMPIPLYGSGEDTWRVIWRPVLPIVFAQPIPTGIDNNFNTKSGLGDWDWELFLTPPSSLIGENLVLGVGTTTVFPTSTSDDLGNQQFAMGPALVLGWKTPKFISVLVPSYNFHIGNRSDRKSSTPNTSSGSMIYVTIFNLPNAWQVGMNPTITYDHKARSGDKWNVPVGLFAAKTIKIGNTPVNIRAGLEYSVVSQDTFGKRAMLRFQITPVIPSLIKNSIFGGN